MAGVVIPTSLPAFSYSSTNYITELKSDWGWIVRFSSSGTLIFTEDQVIDVYILGGGGSGGGGNASVGGGGGGGYHTMKYGIKVTAGTEYPIVVGAGASIWNYGSAGGQSSAFGYTADGGGGGGFGDSKGTWASGGEGGTGKGGARGWAGASNYVREFGETDTSWPIYGGGGGAGGEAGGTPYGGSGDSSATGYGGGGGGSGGAEDGQYDYGGAGYQGIVCIRNSATDVYPIAFNGFNSIKAFTYCGTTPSHMTFNTKTLF